MHDPILLMIVFVFGIIIGSFLNVLIYRLPRKLSLIRPRSKCPRCDSKIKFYDNVPIFSYLILRGKCRACGGKIPFRYPVVEALAGILSVVALFHFGITLRGFEALFLSLVFIAIFFIDLEFTIIPDVFTLPGVIIGFGISFFPDGFVNWNQSLIGLLVGGGSFFLVGMLGEFLFKKEALGFGDVKFAAMLGAFLGWQNLILILILASFLGSVVGIAMIYFTRKKGKSSYIPFGPFLVAGALIAVYFGDIIIRAYLDFIGA
jgi:leader peptidase (prepilin peptidase)/N-methyltransferase